MIGEFDVSGEPIHVISLGAGVQSSTMALMAAQGEIVPTPIAGVFADTQAEPLSVYKWLSWLCGVEVKTRIAIDPLTLEEFEEGHVDPGVYQSGKLSFPVHIITKGHLTNDILQVHERKDGDGKWMYAGIPAFTVNKKDGSKGIIQRQCTWSYKVEMLDLEARRLIGKEKYKAWRRKHFTALKELSKWLAAVKEAKKVARKLNAHPDLLATIVRTPPRPKEAWEECQNDVLVVTWMGISLDEVGRMKQARHPWQAFRYPLVDLRMKRHDCLNWMNENGFPKPPRSACVYCPYHSDQEWRRLRDEEPAAFAEAVRVDHEYRRLCSLVSRKNSIPYLHASRVPLDQVDFSTDEDRGQQVLFGNECEGACGV